MNRTPFHIHFRAAAMSLAIGIGALLLCSCEEYQVELPPAERSDWAITLTDTTGGAMEGSLMLMLQQTDEGIRSPISVLISARLDYPGKSVNFPPYLNNLYKLYSHGYVEAVSSINGLDGAVCSMVYVSSRGTVFASSDAGVYRSTDNGVAWTSVGIDVASASGMCEVAPGVLLLAGDEIWRSADDGSTWARVTSVGPDAANFSAIAAGSDGRIYAGTGIRGQGAQDGLWRSDDAGRSWSRVETAGFKGISRLRVDGRNRVWAACGWEPYYHENDHMELVRSDDGGVTWKSISYFRTAVPFWDLDLSFVYGDTVYAASAMGGSKSLHRSTDGGETWTMLWQAPVWLFANVSLMIERDGTIDIGCDGVYISYTGGASFWEHYLDYRYLNKDFGHMVRDLALGQDGRLWVANDIIYQRGDDGRSWKRMSGRFTQSLSYKISGDSIRGSYLMIGEQKLDSTRYQFAGIRR